MPVKTPEGTIIAKTHNTSRARDIRARERYVRMRVPTVLMPTHNGATSESAVITEKGVGSHRSGLPTVWRNERHLHSGEIFGHVVVKHKQVTLLKKHTNVVTTGTPKLGQKGSRLDQLDPRGNSGSGAGQVLGFLEMRLQPFKIVKQVDSERTLGLSMMSSIQDGEKLRWRTSQEAMQKGKPVDA